MDLNDNKVETTAKESGAENLEADIEGGKKASADGGRPKLISGLLPDGSEVALPEYSDASVPQPKKQKLLIKVLFLLINVAVVIALIAIERRRAGSIPNLTEAIKSSEHGWKYIIGAISMFFVMVVAESLCYVTMFRVTKNGYRPWLAVKGILLGRYYDNVTPFAMGGQPFQMYYFKSNGISTSAAFSAPLVRHAVKLLSVNVIILIMYAAVRTDISLGIKIAAGVGILFNLTFPAFMLLVALNKNFAFKLAKGLLRVACKLKLIKDYDKTVDKLIKQTEEFTNTLKFLGTHFWLFAVLSLLSIIDVLALVSVPYFVIKAFGLEVGYFDSVVKGMYAMNASSYVPTPGAVGGAEAYFYGIYGNIFAGGNFFWGVMLWRIITYYSFLFIGIALNISVVVKNSVKTNRYNRKIKQLLGETETLEQQAYEGNTAHSDKADESGK